jgi:8-oxo-dGTP diphosphatase
VVKPGQQPEKVAVRETYGETDVHCAVARELGGRVHPRSGVYCHYFLCDYLAGEPRNMDPAENAAVSWVCRTEVTRYIQADILYPPALLALEGTA